MRMNISVPDTLAQEVRERNLPISAVCQRALSAEIDRLRSLEGARKEMRPITVPVGDAWVTVGFTGRWLVHPDSHEAETREPREDDFKGAFWGVAQTQKGRIAVYMGTHGAGFAPELLDYDSLDQAAKDEVPEDVLQRAAEALGEDRVLWRDI
jgi:hypothetical protein